MLRERHGGGGPMCSLAEGLFGLSDLDEESSVEEFFDATVSNYTP